MVTKVIKDDLLANVGTETGIEATLSIEETGYSKFISHRRDQGYGLYTYYKVSKGLDFLLGHRTEAVEVSEAIDVFDLVQKAMDSRLKIELVYKGFDLLQVPMKQSFEICTIKSKLTHEEFSLKCSVTTRIPLYQLGFISDALIEDFNPETQRVIARHDEVTFPYVLDDAKIAQRTVILHTDLESAKDLHKLGDILQGYFPQYVVAGVLCTPMVTCGNFCMTRITQRNR